jgi:hypothetical protein
MLAKASSLTSARPSTPLLIWSARQAEDRLRPRISRDTMEVCWMFGIPLPMPHGSVAFVIERQKLASTFGSGVYPWGIQEMSGQSEKASLHFVFTTVLATAFISLAKEIRSLFFSLVETRVL